MTLLHTGSEAACFAAFAEGKVVPDVCAAPAALQSHVSAFALTVPDRKCGMHSTE